MKKGESMNSTLVLCIRLHENDKFRNMESKELNFDVFNNFGAIHINGIIYHIAGMDAHCSLLNMSLFFILTEIAAYS